ncbi:hypothetical protein PGB90_010328 [Kerria lacca]
MFDGIVINPRSEHSTVFLPLFHLQEQSSGHAALKEKYADDHIKIIIANIIIGKLKFYFKYSYFIYY